MPPKVVLENLKDDSRIGHKMFMILSYKDKMPYDCPKIVCESGARFTKYLTTVLRLSLIMPQLRSTYDGRVIYKTSYEERKAFLRYHSLAYRTIVSDRPMFADWLTIFLREMFARC